MKRYSFENTHGYIALYGIALNGSSETVWVITVPPGMVGVVHNSESDPSLEGEGRIKVSFEAYADGKNREYLDVHHSCVKSALVSLPPRITLRHNHPRYEQVLHLPRILAFLGDVYCGKFVHEVSRSRGAKELWQSLKLLLDALPVFSS